MNILKTKAQKKREKKHSKILEMYSLLRSANPDSSDHAIFVTIASRIGWTRVGVSKVINRTRTQKNN